MRYLIILLLAAMMWACEESHVADLQPALRGDECASDFRVEATFDKGCWWFDAYDVHPEVIYCYWTIDGEMMPSEDEFPMESVPFVIPQGAPCVVCFTYMAADGCHEQCVTVHPDMCDNENYSEYSF